MGIVSKELWAETTKLCILYDKELPYVFLMGYFCFGFKTHWIRFKKLLIAISRLPSTYASIDYSSHWHWESDRLMLALSVQKPVPVMTKVNTTILACLPTLTSPANIACLSWMWELLARLWKLPWLWALTCMTQLHMGISDFPTWSLPHTHSCIIVFDQIRYQREAGSHARLWIPPMQPNSEEK